MPGKSKSNQPQIQSEAVRNGNTYYYTAVVLEEMGEEKLAVTYYTKAISFYEQEKAPSKNSKQGSLQASLANCRANLKKLTTVASDTKASSAKPFEPKYKNNDKSDKVYQGHRQCTAGTLLEENGKTDLAIKCYTKAIDLYTNVSKREQGSVTRNLRHCHERLNEINRTNANNVTVAAHTATATGTAYFNPPVTNAAMSAADTGSAATTTAQIIVDEKTAAPVTNINDKANQLMADILKRKYDLTILKEYKAPITILLDCCNQIFNNLLALMTMSFCNDVIISHLRDIELEIGDIYCFGMQQHEEAKKHYTAATNYHKSIQVKTSEDEPYDLIFAKKFNALATIFASVTNAATAAPALPIVHPSPISSLPRHFYSSADNSESVEATASSPLAAATEHLFAAHTAASVTDNPAHSEHALRHS